MFHIVLIEPEIPCPVSCFINKINGNGTMPSPFQEPIEDGMEYRYQAKRRACSI
jgi:hypothetical protein